MNTPVRTATGGALTALLLAIPLSAAATGAEVEGDPDNVPSGALEDSVTEMGTADSITGFTPEDFIEPLEHEDVEGGTTTVTISADVLFEFDEAALSDGAQRTLSDTAERLSGVSGTVEVVGHSDGLGDDSYNQELSEDRADAVKEALEDELGSAAPEIEASGMGSDDPVAEETDSDGEDNPGARAQNRRVEISFEGE
ncbi:outer membrane protein OmpA-like peptidoglycan-associated protein [Lipingzhangella halophila]|uniref:Outer membrane protein OmpA-like peptidoglycan-associated protein n=1 Tax=Lipingzhangella halophila TaxID=1783352 RepID=A0A7W7RGH2_9ACTN|nr:OmpA family protein [Lipingzhangella halophila]MBB4931462.1 outer membrane protein OmpA-like peptidoglycan-associated protein [Lipingzhangella halophila]